jgi:molybdopterin synthase catalytic subunit
MREVDANRLHVEVIDRPIDVQALAAWAADPGAGAVLTFVGTVRDSKQGKRVVRIDYEAYAPMAVKVLRRIGEEMLARWPVCRAALVHRVGRLEIGDASLALVVSAPHRAEGFEALRHAIESVKRDVPIWKKEVFEDGEVWVQEGS